MSKPQTGSGTVEKNRRKRSSFLSNASLHSFSCRQGALKLGNAAAEGSLQVRNTHSHFDSGSQFRRLEWFGDVLVSARLKRLQQAGFWLSLPVNITTS